jgi:hypothetical protein
MNIHQESLADFLRRMQVLLDNIEGNATIATNMGLFGYDAVRLQEGRALLDALNAADKVQVKEYAEQYAATQAVMQAWEQTDQQYGLHRALAKRVFKGDVHADRALLLNEKKSRKRAIWLRQAGLFYDSLLASPDWVLAMGKFGQTQAGFEAAQTAVSSVRSLDGVQQDETGEAQKATLTRDEAWAEARVWVVTATEVAHFALTDDPQLLESLGVVVK